MTPAALRELATIPAEDIPDALAELERLKAELWARLTAPAPPSPTSATTWREKLWTAPPKTRLGVRECAEALGKPVSWVYRAKELPRRKQGGELVFTVGELRDWLEQSEKPEAPGAPAARVIPIQRRRRIT